MEYIRLAGIAIVVFHFFTKYITLRFVISTLLLSLRSNLLYCAFLYIYAIGTDVNHTVFM